MFAVTIDLDAYDTLPPRQLKAMLRALRFADEGGVVHASLTMLAMPGLSRSTVHRELAGLEDQGHVERQERAEGGFLYRIGRRFRSAPSPIRRDRLHCRDQHDDRDDHGRHGDRGHRPSRWGARPAHIHIDRDVYDVEHDVHASGASGDPPDGTPVLADETPVPQVGTTDSRATPAVKNLSSGSKRTFRGRALSQPG